MIKRWISIIILLFLIVANLPQKAFAGPLDEWSIRSPLPTGNTLSDVAFGNNTFVAIGNNGTILTSSDGANWTSRASGTANQLFHIIYENNLFVTVGAGGTILTSSDGANWTSRASGLTTIITGITYGNGTYVAVGSGGKILTSSNGVNWTSRTSGTSNNLMDVTYGNSMYVAVGNNGTIITSSNGANWTSQTSNYALTLSDIAFGNGLFVALGQSGRTLTSMNGVNWLNGSTNSFTAHGISFDNGNFAAVGSNGAILTSSSGVSWTTRSSGTTITLTGVTNGNGTYVVVGETAILTSPDGASWTSRMIGTLSSVLGLTYLNGTYIAVGAGGTIVTSSDGENWTTRASGTLNHLYGVAYGNGLFVTVGSNGTIVTSSDGVSWTIRTSGTTSQLTGITYGNGIYVAIGAGGTIVTSSDGVSWTIQTSGTAILLRGVTFGNGTFVAVGNSGMILTSGNGTSWTTRTSGTANQLNGVTHGNDMYMAVGNSGTIVTSNDGVSWTTRTSGIANHLNGVTYGNGMYVVVGAGGRVLTSGNGASWTSRTSGVTDNFNCVAYGNSTYVAAGASGAIVQSDSVPPAINSVSVSPASANVVQGGSKQLTSTVDAINGVMTTVKWRSNDANVAVDGTGNVTVAAEAVLGDYTITATSTVDSSKKGTATITITLALTAETTPAAGIDYAAEQLTGLEPNGAYTINGTAVTADGSGKVAIDDSWLGAIVNVVKKGNGTTTTDSAAQTLSLPARPAAPVDITVTDITYNGANDGSILNVNLAMEFRKGNAGTWTNTTGTSVVGLEPGVYYVRVAATETVFTSIPAQVTIHDSDATIPAAPNVSADDASNVIIGLDTTMEFSVDGGAYVRYDGTNMPQLSGEHTVQVRVAASGSVPAGPSTALTFTTNVSIPADGLTVTVRDPSGSANDGKTGITITPAPDNEHRLFYFNFGSGTVDIPNVGDTLSGYLNVPSDSMIPAANGDKIGIAEVDAQGRVVKFGQTAAIVIAEQPANEASTGPNEASTGSNEETVDVLINGKVENAGKAKTTESGGIKTTTVVVDPAKLKAKLEAEGVNAVVTIPVKSASNVIVGELNGQMVKNMENLSATLVLQTGKGSYTLPAKEINIDEVADKFGSNVKLEDIQLKISVAQTPDTMVKVVENAEAKGEFSVVVPALDFTVTGTFGGKTAEVTTFNVYVERMVALPDGIDPNKITTGVVVEPNGTVRHVPTKIVLIEGKYYAKINSLTNSTYTVVWHPLEFLDVANHWAKAAVNDMGSRMVIDGMGDGLFGPGRDITRAEFAAILVRGLGLKLENGSTAFSDVKTSDWFSSTINTAYAHELIRGFEDGTFRPNDKITREQAMMILSRAMTITGLKAKLSAQSEGATLHPFGDATNVSNWAQSSVADSVQAGLVSGRSATLLAPKASITRAEVATIIQRLLQTSGLI